MSNGGSKKKKNHQNLKPKMMGTSNQVQLRSFSHTRALFLPLKIAKNHLMRPKRGCPTRLQKFFKGQLKGFSGSPRYKYPKSIAKLNLSYQVKSHEGSTFWKNMTRNRHFPRPAETDPYEDTQWRKDKQMQSVWLCLTVCLQFKEPFQNAHWRKI